MRAFGNVVWYLLIGVWMGILMAVLGTVFMATLIFIPFGKQCFKIMKFSFKPFYKDVTLDINKHPVVNMLWAALLGWFVSLYFAVFGIILSVTVIGIPLAIVAFRGAKLALFPVNAVVEYY